MIKTRLMAQGKAGAGGQQQYSGMFDALVKIPQQEGFTALWRGLLPRLMRIPPGQVGGWSGRVWVMGCVCEGQGSVRTHSLWIR